MDVNVRHVFAETVFAHYASEFGVFFNLLRSVDLRIRYVSTKCKIKFCKISSCSETGGGFTKDRDKHFKKIKLEKNYCNVI